MKETTFKETEKFLVNHGWEIIKPGEYQDLKRNNENQTARIGNFIFLKLKKSNKEIDRDKQISELQSMVVYWREKYKDLENSKW